MMVRTKRAIQPKARPGSTNRPRRRRTKTVTKEIIVRQAKPSVPRCVREYAQAVVDPFNTPPTCLPHEPAIPSARRTYRLRGTFSVGASGYGFVMLKPNIANDGAAVHASGASWTGTTFNTNETYVSPASFPSLVTSSDYTNKLVQTRVVTMGLRCSYMGTKLQQGGMIYGLVEPEHGSLIGKSGVDILSYDKCFRNSVTQDPDAVLTYAPVNLEEYNYSPDADMGTGVSFMGLMAYSSDVSQYKTVFMYEAVITVELIGRNIKGKTPTPAANALSSVVASVINSRPVQTAMQVGATMAPEFAYDAETREVQSLTTRLLNRAAEHYATLSKWVQIPPPGHLRLEL